MLTAYGRELTVNIGLIINTQAYIYCSQEYLLLISYVYVLAEVLAERNITDTYSFILCNSG